MTYKLGNFTFYMVKLNDKKLDRKYKNMKYNFVRLAAANITTKVGNVKHNTKEIKNQVKLADEKGVSILVFPELVLSGYTVADMFNQSILIEACKESLLELADFSKSVDTHFIVGSPFLIKSTLYNVAFFIGDGKILAGVPKINIPNYNEFYEKRWFASGEDLDEIVSLGEEQKLRVCAYQIFTDVKNDDLSFGIEICEDLWSMDPPSTMLAKNGAKIIFNLSASNEISGKNAYRKSLIENQSARTFTSYIYASTGFGESTTDLVFGGKLIIANNGRIVNANKRFSTESDMIYSDIDLELLNNERATHTSMFKALNNYYKVDFDVKEKDVDIEVNLCQTPFIPSTGTLMDERCEEIFNIQAMGLVKRMSHISCKKAVIGISGGLDSTLALLVIHKAFSIMNLPYSNIIAVTMPGFGTSDRTYENAVKLIKTLGLDFKEISIKGSTLLHFKDIGQDSSKKDVVYENAQARERTQILMDLANMHSAIVVGTGDLSELALGFATYNGDQMSMYGVNASVPKTLVRKLVEWASNLDEFKEIKEILIDVYRTPVSPELLPPSESGKIAQVTEDIIGPYELHDFFLFHLLRYKFSPSKILFLAEKTFEGIYDKKTIKKWLQVFLRRFFNSQFKRSCMPDGPKVGSICLSPRGDLRMASDFDKSLWLDDLK